VGAGICLGSDLTVTYNATGEWLCVPWERRIVKGLCPDLTNGDIYISDNGNSALNLMINITKIRKDSII
jgi:hypothetical protein